MAINPIDLQVNFSQLNQVGKQQTMIQGSEILRQDKASEQIQKDGLKNSEDVPETKDLSEGPEKVKEENKKKEQSKKDKSKERKNLKNEKKELFDNELNDPALGQRIDIIG
ncbi:MAG: hypothetical protein JXB50_06455 [Spirochaetes bacterium]|nr:hypothetical protein [Spirochaetota bacterium]